jgi:hypothetical protein
MEKTYVLIFNSVHRVMKAEKLLKNANIKSKTIPVPRKLSSDCGLAIRIPETALETILDALINEKPEEIYLELDNKFERVL